MLRKAKDLMGYTVKATDDDQGDAHIGTVYDFYFDVEAWAIRYLVVDVGSWFFGRRVLLSPASVQAPQWEAKVLPVNLTKAQVKDSPLANFAEPIPREYEADLHEYYGWPTYWGGAGMPYTVGAGLPLAPGLESPTAPNLPGEVVQAMEQSDDQSFVRSIRDVSGYTIKATDGSLGHVADFFVDDENWVIRYLLVDTGNWLPGKQVIISPDWVESIDWGEASMHVKVTQDQVENSPVYDASQPLGRAYESELHEHYGFPEYWK